jgi:apolipoprotein N-acyltransferase
MRSTGTTDIQTIPPLDGVVGERPFIPARPVITLGWTLAAIACFHLAFVVNAWWMIGFLLGVFQVSRVELGRNAFRIGFLIGMLCYAPQSPFIWIIFGPAAVALWSVLAAWLGLYVALQRLAFLRLGSVAGTLAAPVLWLGLEFFRGELYYLRFTWLTAGFAFDQQPSAFSWLGGGYGIGFWLMLTVAASSLALRFCQRRHFTLAVALVVLSAVWPVIAKAGRREAATHATVAFAGVQVFQPHYSELIPRLDKIIAEHPETQVIVLGEYAFDGTVPDKIRAWCAANHRHLIAGGKDEYGEDKYFNTAFVIGTNGTVVHRQAKSVPVQFFKDGTPASSQRVWESPWGRIGLGICYDLSYTRVMDELIRQGAQAIIIPTMDMNDWGPHQQRMHTRVARIRSAEYGTSVLRVCSEGISQLENWLGASVMATSNADGEVLVGKLTLREPVTQARLPLDRILAWPAVILTGALAIWAFLAARNERLRSSNLKSIP